MWRRTNSSRELWDNNDVWWVGAFQNIFPLLFSDSITSGDKFSDRCFLELICSEQMQQRLPIWLRLPTAWHQDILSKTHPAGKVVFEMKVVHCCVCERTDVTEQRLEFTYYLLTHMFHIPQNFYNQRRSVHQKNWPFKTLKIFKKYKAEETKWLLTVRRGRFKDPNWFAVKSFTHVLMPQPVWSSAVCWEVNWFFF